MSDYKGAALMLRRSATSKELPRRQGVRRRLVPQGSHRSAASRCASLQNPIGKSQIAHDRKSSTSERHKIENMFGRLKDWRRIHTRYDRCAHTFMSAICIAAAVIFWL